MPFPAICCQTRPAKPELASSCLSGCFSTLLFVVCMCAALVVFEEFAPVSASICDRVGDCVMNAQRKIIVYIATSADGYIARPDGDVEWLNRRPHTVDYGMRAFYPTIDTILWGRKTYDWLLDYTRRRAGKAGCSTQSSPTTCSRG